MTNKPKSNWNPNEYYKDQNVAESYDGKRFTSLAGRLFNWIEKRLVRRAFSSLPKGALLGDIPTGTGRLAEVLLEDGFQVVGLDISGDMLAVAARRLSRFGTMFRTEVCDARELKEKGYMFEGVLCARVLMHFPLDEQIVFLRNAAAAARHRIVFTRVSIHRIIGSAARSNACCGIRCRPVIR